jgi:hypothetical protein
LLTLTCTRPAMPRRLHVSRLRFQQVANALRPSQRPVQPSSWIQRLKHLWSPQTTQAPCPSTNLAANALRQSQRPSPWIPRLTHPWSSQPTQAPRPSTNLTAPVHKASKTQDRSKEMPTETNQSLNKIEPCRECPKGRAEQPWWDYRRHHGTDTMIALPCILIFVGRISETISGD